MGFYQRWFINYAKSLVEFEVGWKLRCIYTDFRVSVSEFRCVSLSSFQLKWVVGNDQNPNQVMERFLCHRTQGIQRKNNEPIASFDSQNSIYWHICGSDKTRPSFFSPAFTNIKPRANGRNFVPQQLPTLLDVTCCVRLHTLLHVVAQSLKAVKLLHGSSNIVGATHAHYTWSPWRLQSLTGFILPTMHCRS